MTDIIDRRQQKNSRSKANRQKFIERNRRAIQDQIDKHVKRSRIKNVGKNRKVSLPTGSTNEPIFSHDSSTGSKKGVLPRNDTYGRGDKLRKPQQSSGQGDGAGQGQEDGEVDFEFILTKKEFIDLLFDGMNLPDYVKECIADDKNHKWVNAGFSPEGPMTRLSITRTFMQSLARKFAGRGADSKKKVPFLDDIDLRFRLKKKEYLPRHKAVMFCIQDVSYSMSIDHRDLAKRFFLLLYLFLDKKYDDVDIVFIQHTEKAQEVDEHKFFYGRESGGTTVSPAFTLMSKIIEERYDPDTVNIYVAQASDGDNWESDNENLLSILNEKILPVVQYMAYAHIDPLEADDEMRYYMPSSLWDVYNEIDKKNEKFNKTRVTSRTNVYLALRHLFGGDNE